MTVDGKQRKLSFNEFKNLLVEELNYLEIPKSEWNDYLKELICDCSAPRKRRMNDGYADVG